MNRTPRPCTACGQHNGWIACPECSQPHCFDHVVGHGCPYTGPRPTVHIEEIPAHDPAYLWHPWLWSRLYVTLHAVQALSLSDGTASRHMTVFAPSLSGSQTGYFYTANGIGQQPYTSNRAGSLEALMHRMRNDQGHDRLFFHLLSIFVTQQRQAAPSRAGQPVRAEHPDVIRAERRLQNESPTILITSKEIAR